MNQPSTVIAHQERDGELDVKWRHLTFAVLRSIRYHAHRRQFFDGWDKLFCFLVIIFGGCALTNSVSGEWSGDVTIFATAAIAILGAIDLTIGFAMTARDHHDLERDFSELERRIVKAGRNPTWDDYTEMHNRRLEIEEEEPPKKAVLDCYCHNEVCRAVGKPHGEFARIWFFQSWFKQYLDILPSCLVKFDDLKK